MASSNKQEDYLNLIKRAKEYYQANSSHNGLVWYDDCQEINLWTYWQGLGYAETTPDIEILLVGQDWGNPFNEGLQTVKNVRMMNDQLKTGKTDIKYLDYVDLTSREAQTDNNLITLFDSIGYKDIKDRRYEELFFTNYLLGYREEGSNTGGMTVSKLLHDKELFINLCDILQPKKIICLGRIVYEAVLKSFEKSYDSSEKYNDLLDKGENCEYVVRDFYQTKVYGMAHCGYFGSRNRGDVPGTKRKTADLSIQIRDWEQLI